MMNLPPSIAGCPIKFAKALWPQYKMYDRQFEVIEAVRDAKETIVPAGNQLGKDFVAGYICPSFFVNPTMYFDKEYVRQVEAQRRPGYDPHTRRVVTTSVKEDHLRLLWAEIGRFVDGCRIPLTVERGGALVVNHYEIRFAYEAKVKHPVNYMIGRVTEKIEGMAGHHAAYTLFVGDEASGIEDMYLDAAKGWAKKIFLFGNCEACENYFKKAVEGGDILAEV